MKDSGANRPDSTRKYPGRGALKLLGAFADIADLSPDRSPSFPQSLEGRICIDLGAAHGGFTSVLLEKGARRVYTIDVAYGMLDYPLRMDERTVVLERKNVRNLSREWLLTEDKNQQSFFITCDISFMSICTVLDSVANFLNQQQAAAEGIFLLKPQFEASTKTEKGILRDEIIIAEIKEKVCQHAKSLLFYVHGIRPAHIKGREGNQEFILYLTRNQQ